jgi:hypothetical protein
LSEKKSHISDNKTNISDKKNKITEKISYILDKKIKKTDKTILITDKKTKWGDKTVQIIPSKGFNPLTACRNPYSERSQYAIAHHCTCNGGRDLLGGLQSWPQPGTREGKMGRPIDRRNKRRDCDYGALRHAVNWLGLACPLASPPIPAGPFGLWR